MADNANNAQGPTVRQPDKKFWKRMLEENFQWILIAVSILLGIRKPMEVGGKELDGKEPPRWLAHFFPFFFTVDEKKYTQLLDDFDKNPAKQAVFFKFKDKVVAERFDEEHLRLMMSDHFQDWLDREDEKLTKIPRSAAIFIEQIIALDGNYDAQKKLGEEKKFLKKVGPLKAAFRWSRNHRSETIVGFFLIPYALVRFVLWLLGA